MSGRAAVLDWLYGRVGFAFSETELPPALRRRVGEVASLKDEILMKSELIRQKEGWIKVLRSRKSSQTGWLIAFVVLGALLLVVIVGAFLLVAALVLYFRRKKTERLIQERSAEVGELVKQVNALQSSLDPKLVGLSQDIFAELSAAHQAKAISVGNASVVGSGPTVQLVRETIKEIVMVPCAYCHSLMPQTATRCPQCGATRRS